MTRPVDGIGGRCDDAARTRRKNLISTQVEAFRKHGFSCRVDVAAYPAVIDREVWLGMIHSARVDGDLRIYGSTKVDSKHL